MANLNFASAMYRLAFGEELCKAQSLSQKMIIDSYVFYKSYTSVTNILGELQCDLNFEITNQR